MAHHDPSNAGEDQATYYRSTRDHRSDLDIVWTETVLFLNRSARIVQWQDSRPIIGESKFKS